MSSLQQISGAEPDLSVLPTVVVAVPHRAAFKARYLPDIPHGGVFVPGTPTLPAGARVSLDLVIARELLCVQGRGRVRWRRSLGSTGLPAGMGVEFEEAGFGRLVRKLASGEPMRIVPRARRFFCSIDAQCYGEQRLAIGRTRDVSRTGMFLHVHDTFEIGTAVQIRLTPPGMRSMLVHGTVARLEGRGMGVRLTGLDFFARETWQELQRYLLRSLPKG